MERLQEKVLKNVKEKELIKLGKDLIRIPSFTEEESEAAEFLAEFMERKGFEVELQEVEKRRLQVIGKLRGTGEGPSLMLNGHLDIDPLPRDVTWDPFKPVIKNDRLYGAGIFNMKGGVASMVMAADAVRKAGVKLRGDLIIAGVVGELQGGIGTVYLLKKGIKPDVAIVTEPTHLDLMTIHAGVVEMAITTLGKSQHVIRKEYAIDALEKMVKVINALKKVEWTFKPHPELPGLPRMVIGSIIGGRGRKYELRGPYNTMDICTVIIDCRIVPGQTAESTKQDIENILKDLKAEDPEFEYEIKLPPLPFKCDRVPMLPLDLPQDESIVQMVKRNHEKVTGKSPRVGAILPISYAGNDDSHLWEAGIPAFSYGPGHEFTPGESLLSRQYVDVYDLVVCTKVLALTTLDVCTKTREKMVD